MADIRYALKHGDKTTTGGTLLATSSFATHHGTPLALEGDIATCPACNADGKVYNDCQPFCTIMGRSALVSGARVHCKCEQRPLVLHSQTDSTVEVQPGRPTPAALKGSRDENIPLTAFHGGPTSNQSENAPPQTATGQREYIEVLILDGRIISPGSQWGHAAIEIDGIVYSRAPTKYHRGSYRDYLIGQTRRPWTDTQGTVRGMHRDGAGFLLWVTTDEKTRMRDELERRVREGAEYGLLSNSCTTNVAEVLAFAGIVSSDPRYFATPVSPKEMFMMLGRSSRLVERRDYKKGWQGGASDNW
ncbi:PAAR domain-containing protein [Cupriavidus sp. SW-Y-13]|uniref:PAAR domain-containing protein n=1 Tax=Cupriavidus sp. SW-Y-13 TaxID=2653854 RepID=UPI001365A418|nr:PAAR domain-containing protein [Cupriavidus sp. SW-Y-13]